MSSTAPAYYLTPPTTTNGPCGGGYTPDGTIPAGAVVCTQTQAQSPNLWTMSNDIISALAPPAPTLAQHAATALSAGVTISLSGSITLAPTLFPCDPITTTKISTVLNIFNVTGSFPDGGTTCGMKTAGANPTWPAFTGSQYGAIVLAIGNYVFILDQIIDGNPAYTTLPNPVIPTITV